MENWSKPQLSLHLLNSPGCDEDDDDYDDDNDKNDHDDDDADGDGNGGDIDDDDENSYCDNWYRPQPLHPQCNRPPPEGLLRTISPEIWHQLE